MPAVGVGEVVMVVGVAVVVEVGEVMISVYRISGSMMLVSS